MVICEIVVFDKAERLVSTTCEVQSLNVGWRKGITRLARGRVLYKNELDQCSRLVDTQEKQIILSRGSLIPV